MKLKNKYTFFFLIICSTIFILPVYSQTIKPMAQSLNISEDGLETDIKPIYKKIKDIPVIDDIENKMLDPVFKTNSEQNEFTQNKHKTDSLPAETRKFEQSLSINSAVKQTEEPPKEVFKKNEAPKTLTEINIKAEQIHEELRSEEQKVLKDLRVLWAAAIEKSTTIRLSIQKLSNPNEAENIKDGSISKLLSPLAGLAPLAAMASSSATQTAGALFGGSLLDTFSDNSNNQYNKSFVKVSDFDLVMLSKAVDELQSELIVKYYNYINSIEKMKFLESSVLKTKKINEEAKDSNNFSQEMISDAFYREAVQNYEKSKQAFLSARTELEQITGNAAIINIETSKLTENINPDNKQELQK